MLEQFPTLPLWGAIIAVYCGAYVKHVLGGKKNA